MMVFCLLKRAQKNKTKRAQVEPCRLLLASAPQRVRQERTEEEQCRDRVDPAGDPGDAFGMERQDGKDERGVCRGDDAHTRNGAGDGQHEQRVRGVEGDVRHMVGNGRRRSPDGCQLIRHGGERTNLVLGRAPDVVHPGRDEPSGEVERWLLRKELHHAEIVVHEIVARGRHVGAGWPRGRSRERRAGASSKMIREHSARSG